MKMREEEADPRQDEAHRDKLRIREGEPHADRTEMRSVENLEDLRRRDSKVRSTSSSPLIPLLIPVCLFLPLIRSCNEKEKQDFLSLIILPHFALRFRVSRVGREQKITEKQLH